MRKEWILYAFLSWLFYSATMNPPDKEGAWTSYKRNTPSDFTKTTTQKDIQLPPPAQVQIKHNKTNKITIMYNGYLNTGHHNLQIISPFPI